MKPSSVAKDSIYITLQILDDEDCKIGMGHTLSEDVPEEISDFYTSVLLGLNYHLSFNAEMLARMGDILLYTNVLEDEAEGVAFEPDEALKEAVADKKVVDIKTRMN